MAVRDYWTVRKGDANARLAPIRPLDPADNYAPLAGLTYSQITIKWVKIDGGETLLFSGAPLAAEWSASANFTATYLLTPPSAVLNANLGTKSQVNVMWEMSRVSDGVKIAEGNIVVCIADADDDAYKSALLAASDRTINRLTCQEEFRVAGSSPASTPFMVFDLFGPDGVTPNPDAPYIRRLGVYAG